MEKKWTQKLSILLLFDVSALRACSCAPSLVSAPSTPAHGLHGGALHRRLITMHRVQLLCLVPGREIPSPLLLMHRCQLKQCMAGSPWRPDKSKSNTSKSDRNTVAEDTSHPLAKFETNNGNERRRARGYYLFSRSVQRGRYCAPACPLFSPLPQDNDRGFPA